MYINNTYKKKGNKQFDTKLQNSMCVLADVNPMTYFPIWFYRYFAVCNCLIDTLLLLLYSTCAYSFHNKRKYRIGWHNKSGDKRQLGCAHGTSFSWWYTSSCPQAAGNQHIILVFDFAAMYSRILKILHWNWLGDGKLF